MTSARPIPLDRGWIQTSVRGRGAVASSPSNLSVTVDVNLQSERSKIALKSLNLLEPAVLKQAFNYGGTQWI